MRILFLLILLFLLVRGFSQEKSTNFVSSYIFESFEKPDFPPKGWVKKMPLGGTGWGRLSPNCPYPGWYYFALPAPQWGGKSYAVASFCTGNSTWDSPGYPNEQWLISPPLLVHPGDSLKFRVLSCNAYQTDSLDVMVSTTNDSVTSFTTTLLSLLSTNFTSTTYWFFYNLN